MPEKGGVVQPVLRGQSVIEDVPRYDMIKIMERCYHGADRIRPSVAQALPKYVIGTTLFDGVTPG